MKFNVEDLVGQGLVRKKTYTTGKYKGLSVLKYTRKVFYDNLWHVDSRLLECRGMVVDEEDNIVVWPFTKCFNRFENGAGADLPPEYPIVAVEKVNGFLGCVTMTDKYGLVVSTTGTLDSEYADLARKHIENLDVNFPTDHTFMFEICDKSDPHIVEEHEGAYLIGCRPHNGNILYPEQTLDAWVESWMKGVKRPKVFNTTVGELQELSKVSKLEGYMVIEPNDWFGYAGKTLYKLKTLHYLNKKALMRIGKAKVDIMYDNTQEFKKRLDEEFYGLLDYIVSTIDREVWRSYSDQHRRHIIERYFNHG